MTALLAPHPRKAKMQIATFQVAIDHIGDTGPPETVALSMVADHCYGVSNDSDHPWHNVNTYVKLIVHEKPLHVSAH